MKNNKLRYISKLLMFTIIACSTISCYDDFVENEFEFTSVYYPKPAIARSFIMGEGMQIGVGVVLGGRLENNKEVEVTFSLDESLLDSVIKLPDNYYTLVDADGNPANNKIIIPAGKTQGFVYVKADSINFLSDSLSLGNNYALGFTLNEVKNADSILTDPESTKFKSTQITFTYINQLFGNYIQKGEFVKTGLVDNPDTEEDETVATTIEYPGQITDALALTMLSPTSLEYEGIADLRGADKKLKINIQADNSITIETADSGLVITDDGGSSYDPSTRKLILNYSFNFNGFDYKASDVLEFRNRVVDGVNQFFE